MLYLLQLSAGIFNTNVAILLSTVCDREKESEA